MTRRELMERNYARGDGRGAVGDGKPKRKRAGQPGVGDGNCGD